MMGYDRFLKMDKTDLRKAKKVFMFGERTRENEENFWRWLGRKYGFTVTLEGLDLTNGYVLRPDQEEFNNLLGPIDYSKHGI